MAVKDIKKILENNSIDPLLIVIANKGYKWIIESDLNEEEAIRFEEYILNNTNKDELEEIKTKKKSLRDFLVLKYINLLDR